MLQTRVFLLAALCALLTTVGQIVLKAGVSTPALGSVLGSGSTLLFLVRALTSPVVIGGLVLYGASAALWLVVLARADLSYALPLVSLGFVFSAIYAHYVLHEPVGLLRIAGIALIILGVTCVARS